MKQIKKEGKKVKISITLSPAINSIMENELTNKSRLIEKLLIEYYEKKICSKCGMEKDISYFYKNKYSKTGYRSECSMCGEKKNKERRGKMREYQKEFRIKNRENVNNIQKKYYRSKKDDVLFKLKRNIRCRISSFIKLKKITKNNRTFKMIGCNPYELKKYIEEKFTEGMCWEKYGVYGWHIDHIIPLDLAETEEDLFKLSHYTNLQPLWSFDNLSKGKKIPENTVFNETL
jgi:hypothetical protein